MARDSEPKRRFGVAMYWVHRPEDVEEAHLLARLGGHGSMTQLVRDVVDARLGELRVTFAEALTAAQAARADG